MFKNMDCNIPCGNFPGGGGGFSRGEVGGWEFF